MTIAIPTTGSLQVDTALQRLTRAALEHRAATERAKEHDSHHHNDVADAYEAMVELSKAGHAFAVAVADARASGAVR